MKASKTFALFWNPCSLLFLLVLAAVPVAEAGGMITTPTQAALEAALAGGGTATFACNGTIVLTNTITISADTILDGNGYAVAISGGNAVRIFQVATNVNFWIRSLTLSDGSMVGTNGADGAPPSPGQDAFGGAILSEGGTLTLTSCVLSNNSVQGGNGGNLLSGTASPARGGTASGGAICVVGGGTIGAETLNMTNCTLVGNTATGGIGTQGTFGTAAGDAGDANGGAIYGLGATVNLQSVTLVNNKATGGVATAGFVPSGPWFGSRAGNGAGAAIYAGNSTTLVSGAVLSANSANGGGLVGGASQQGTGAGSGLGAGLFVDGASSASIKLSTFVSNVATGGGGVHEWPSGPALGGAVCSYGILQVSDSRFATNQALSGAVGIIPNGIVPMPGRGGGIYSQGLLSIRSSTVDGNLAKGGDGLVLPGQEEDPGASGEGGGIWSSNVLNVTNCTLTANRALGGNGAGGGAGTGGGFLTASGGTLINLTLAGNRADSLVSTGAYAGPVQGGGLAVTNTPPTLRGTIIANSANGSNVWGVVTDAGYNISSDASAGFSGHGSLNNTDPLLDALANNGGPTPTMALLPGSPARDIIPSGFPPTDQRGVPRPQGPAADAGAYEAQPPPPVLAMSLSRTTVTISFNAQGGFSYELLSSTNLRTWFSVATNSVPSGGPLSFVQSFSPGQSTFYRVVTP